MELINELNTFSNFSGLKPNKTKWEIRGIGILNRVQVAWNVLILITKPRQ